MPPVIDLLEGVLNVVDVIVDTVKHPRFYVPLLSGVAVAVGVLELAAPGDMRETLVICALLGGLAVGILWDWSHRTARF